MNKNKPVGSKLLNKLWLEFEKHLHNQRLREVTSGTEVMMRTPPQMSHLNQNSKKMVKLDEKYTEIERENHLLLSKLKHILKNKTHKVSGVEFNGDKSPDKIRSLNFRKRKQFLEDITKTNRKFLVTLNSQKSAYNFKDMEKDRKHKEKLIRSIWEYEPTLFSDDRGKRTKKNSDLKLKNLGPFEHRKKSLNKMFKIKRRESESDSKLPPLTTVKTEQKMSTKRGLEKFSTFDTIIKTSRKKFFSSSPRRSKNHTQISKNHSKSKITTKGKNKPTPMPFIVKRYQKKLGGHRIDRSRSKNDIVNWFTLVDKLTKKQRVFV